jgi:hypothetical protein
MFSGFILFLAVLATPVVIWLAFWAIFLVTKVFSRRKQVAANSSSPQDGPEV